MTLVIGHKGASTLEPENRVASFVRARELGADGVELDVRRTGDGGLVVWHDPWLADGRVLLEHTSDQLGDAAEGVDGLEAVLDACVGLALVNVEVKNWPIDPDFDASLGIADAVGALLAGRTAGERESFVVSCFHLETVDRVREQLDGLAPDIRTGWLVWAVDDPEQMVATAVDHGHQAVHPHYTAVTPALVSAAQAAKVAINVWTCNDPDDIRRLADLGVDGIITDRPDEALAALAR